jgi:spoIIIJ-associated protein
MLGGRARTRCPTSRPSACAPMGAAERRTVHEYLRERTEVQTHSEGDEPERRLVVTPVTPDAV